MLVIVIVLHARTHARTRTHTHTYSRSNSFISYICSLLCIQLFLKVYVLYIHNVYHMSGHNNVVVISVSPLSQYIWILLTQQCQISLTDAMTDCKCFKCYQFTSKTHVLTLLVTCSFSSLNNNLSSSLVLCHYVLDVVVSNMLQMHKKILISPVMNTERHRTEDIVCLVGHVRLGSMLIKVFI